MRVVNGDTVDKRDWMVLSHSTGHTDGRTVARLPLSSVSAFWLFLQPSYTTSPCFLLDTLVASLFNSSALQLVASLLVPQDQHYFLLNIMGKEENKSSNKSQLIVNETSKWKVIDVAGIKQQPKDDKASSKDGLQGRRATKSSGGPRMDNTKSIGGDSFVQRTANPSWLQDRVSVYEKIKARREEELQKKQPTPITVTMPDGKVLSENSDGTKFQAWITTPYDVAVSISQGLADSSAVARVQYESFAPDYSLAEDGMEGEDTLSDAMKDAGMDNNLDKTQNTHLWDMTRPFIGTVAKLELLKFEQDQDAKTVFWHSSAHMMGEALEHLYGCKLTIGPPLAGGFYYDSYMGSDTLREDDCT